MRRLPVSLSEAVAHLEKSDVLREAMGSTLYGAFLAVRKAEIEAFEGQDPNTIAAAHRWRYGGEPVVPATQVLDALPLVDDHCHGIAREVADREAFESHINEGFDAPPAGTSHFDTPIGLAVRRWCPPSWVSSRTPRPRCTSSDAPSSVSRRSTGG